MRWFVLFLPWLSFTLALPGFALSNPQLVEGLVNIKFQLDSRVFAATAALNAAGFDLDAAELAENPPRKLVREWLSRMPPELLERLRQFYVSHDVERDPLKQQSKYISLSLSLTGAPEFRLKVKPRDAPSDVQSLIGFEDLIRETWEKGDLVRLWGMVQPFYLKEIESQRPVIRQTILTCLRYMHTEPRIALDRQVIFIPDLLNAYGVVNARNLGDTYIVIVGPFRTAKSMHGIRHEYLHFMIDPLIAKYTAYLPEAEPFLESVRQRPRVLARYKEDFSLVVTESLIGSIERRLNAGSDEEKAFQLVTGYDEGLVLAPYFEEALKKFERGRPSLQEFIPELLQGIRWDIEKKRPELLARLRDELASRHSHQQAQAQAEGKRDQEARDLLTDANKSLLAGDFDKAKELLSQVLRRDPDNASALYGMAQIAGQNQDLEGALGLYERAARNAGEQKWIAAWCLVRRGNIFYFQRDTARARSEWSTVLDMKGDLRGAREEASKALSGK